MIEDQPPALGPDAPAAVELHPMVLAAALVAGTIGCAVPVLLLVGQLAISTAWAETAEYLQWTGGLEPATFGGGFWVASGANLACLLESLRRRINTRDRANENPWMPLLALAGFYVFGLSATLYAELVRRVDVPDVLHSALLLGFFELVVVILPVLLLLVWTRGVRTAWRVSRASAASARRVTGLSSAMGICGAYLMSNLVVGAVHGYFDADQGDDTETPLAMVGGVPFVEGLRSAFEAEAETLQGSSLVAEPRVPARKAASPVDTCVESLYLQREGGATLTAILSSRIGWKYKLPSDVADEVVIKKLFDVCRQHVMEPLDNLGAYLMTATDNAARDVARVKRNRFNFGVGGEADYEATYSPDQVDSMAFRNLDRCFKEKLEPRERELVRLRFLGGEDSSWRSAGEAVGLNVFAAEKAGQRALRKLRKCLEPIAD